MDDHEVILYQKADGSVPVRDLILGLPHGMREKAVHDLELLQQYGPRLREPHSKLIGDGIFELRIRFANDIARVSSFFFAGKKIIVTNGYVKKTQKMLRREWKRALAYKRDWEERGSYGGE